MSGITYLLNFLLVVETFKHEVIKQTPDDLSRYVTGRSFFYDIKDLKIKKASLIGKNMIFTVDLIDGHFEIDGRVFYTTPPPPGAKLELIYYRQVQQRLGVSLNEQKQYEPIVRYYLGWQTNYKGKNVKMELGLD